MAKYKVDRKCYIGDSLYEAGDIVEYDGKPSKWMTKIREDKPKRGSRVGAAKKEEATQEPAAKDGELVTL